MASNINPFNIDGTFPVAGQDNSSQGFRDNFTNIRNNLGTAASEITDLQNKAVLTSALTGRTLTNDMGGTVLYHPALKSYYEVLYDQGLLTGTVTLDYANGNYQRVTATGAITLAFANWPAAGVLGRMVLRISNSSSYNLSFPVTNPGVTVGLTNISGYSNGTVSFDFPGDYVFEFTTIDNGQNIVIRDLTRNGTVFNSPGLYYNSQVNSSIFVGYDNSTAMTTAMNQIETGTNDQISALGAYSAVSVGNLSVANVTYPRTDINPLGGYNIKAVRGNIISNTTLTSYNAVRSNDYMGFLETVQFTGNGSGNAFAQSSTIGFFATGSNLQYGLGSNIAVFAKADGGNISQALGIENDTSTKFYGNVLATLGRGVPAVYTSTGVAGQIAVDTNYLYVCVATNVWKRVALNITSW